MALLRPAGANYIGVSNLAAAAAWYTEKLGLHKVSVAMDDGEGCVALGFDHKEPAVVLGPADRSSGESSPLMYASNLKKAREFLSARGVNVGEIQRDRQNTHFFEMRDLEGNVIEVSEEP